MHPTPPSPRDLLVGRHTTARSALDAQRDALLVRFAAPPADRFLNFRDLLATLHRELFAPCRHAWTALACAWLAILVFQQLDRLASSPLNNNRIEPTTTAAPLLALWLEQRRQLAALTADPAPRTVPSRETLPPPTPSRPLGCIAPSAQAMA